MDIDLYLSLVKTYPHCDALVLHNRGTCWACDLPEMAPLHEYRLANNINYTDEHCPDKQQCPAHARRTPEIINRWYGNRAEKDCP